MANTTWDVLDKDPAITLTAADLTATVSSVARESGTRAAHGKTSGKYYFEVTVNATGGNTNIAIVTRGDTWTRMNASDLSGVFCYAAFNIYFNGTNTTRTIGGFAATNVVCVAVDLDNSKVWFRKAAGNWNGQAGDNPATNTGGIDISSINGFPWFPYVGMGVSTTAGFTANFGDAAFAHTVPSGFTSGWPDTSVTAGAAMDPSNTGTGLTLSNSNRTIRANSPSSIAMSRSLGSAGSGKYYFEWFKNDSSTAANNGVGMCNTSAVASQMGADALNGILVFNGSGVANAGGSVYVNGVRQGVVSLLGRVGGGNIVGIAVDLTAGLVWCRKGSSNWNGDAGANPATGAGGFDISAIGVPLFTADVVTNGDTVDCSSLNSSSYQKLVVPSGFTAGYPVGAGGGSGTPQASVSMM